MKQIFARWPKLERRCMRNLATVALGMFLVWVVLALALGLSGCAVAMPQDQKPATWVPSTHVTGAEVMFEYDDGGWGYYYTQVYVYECNPNMARIDPNGIFTRARWIERSRLRPDVCLVEQP